MSTFSDALIGRADQIVEDDFPKHPFENGVTATNFDSVIANYLTMSLAFPYLQAGAQLRLLFHYIENDLDITRGVEITAAVGAFLTWDEAGGHKIVQEHGNAGLPKILETDQFHANLLRKDIETLTGKSLPPAFTNVTKEYLRRLEYGLSSVDPVTRVVHMVAFEKHAGRMIDALWSSASALFTVDKDSLLYFSTHVGGDDPAEEYHVQMTARMIDEIVKEADVGRFADFFKDAYALNINWCDAICRIGP